MAQGCLYLVGVDGGGTGSRAVLLDRDTGKRIERQGGPANVFSDFDGAVAQISDLLQHLLSDAGLPALALGQTAGHLGLAGVMDGAMATRVAENFPMARISVTDDQATTIAGALGNQDGTVAAIGTGSFFGRRQGGIITKRGGWGFVLGDQASGAWLGKRLLEKSLKAHDAIARDSDLTKTMLERFGGANGVTAFSLRATPADFAVLAPEIVTAALAGDLVATRLMRDGAEYVTTALGSIGWQDDEALCLTGGLGPAYAGWLKPETALVFARGSALDGALAFAGQLAVAQ